MQTNIWIRACILTVILVFVIGGLRCAVDNDTVRTQCTQTARNKLDATPRQIIPRRINVSASRPVVRSSQTASMNLGLCPDNRFLKISWAMHYKQEMDIQLCYMLEAVTDGSILGTACFNLHAHYSEYPTVMDCWFQMDFTDNGHIITIWAATTYLNTEWTYYGRLDTTALDPVNSCMDICEVEQMEIQARITCHEASSIVFTNATSIHRLSFASINNAICEDDDSIRVLRQTDHHIEYQLNCDFDGLGHVKVLYSIEEQYCLKYQMVRAICFHGHSTDGAAASSSDDVHSFGTFVIFGIVCIAVITVILFISIFVVQWLMWLRMSFLKAHHNQDRGSRHVNVNAEEGIPLQPYSPKPTGSKMDTCVSLTPASIIKDVESRRRSLSNLLLEERAAQGTLVIPLRRSITMALLEDTDQFYKKRILFCPIPFDTYSRDVIDLLKKVFMDEAGIVCQCCFDRKVFQEYLTGDRFKWIENVLGDHNKILIFLCFTSLSVETKRDSMVEEILDHLLLSRIKSHRLCNVVLVHLTDSPANVQNRHHGDSFHISNVDDYVSFLENVMSYCGRNPDGNPDLIQRLSNCKYSKRFLSFIGLNKHSSNDCQRSSTRLT